jgi:hypothetical protein
MRTIDVILTAGGRYTLTRSPSWLSLLSFVKYVDRNASESYSQLRWRAKPFEHFDLTYYDGSVESYLPCDSRNVYCYQIGYRNAQGQQLKFQRASHRPPWPIT